MQRAESEWQNNRGSELNTGIAILEVFSEYPQLKEESNRNRIHPPLDVHEIPK